MRTKAANNIPTKAIACILALLLAIGMTPYAQAAEQETQPAKDTPAADTQEPADTQESNTADDTQDADILDGQEANTTPDTQAHPPHLMRGLEETSQDEQSSVTTPSQDDPTDPAPQETPAPEDIPYTSEITDADIAAALAQIAEPEGPSARSLSSEDSDYSTLGAVTGDKIKSFSGSDRFETAALQATYGRKTSEYAILIGFDGWPDALSGTSLAGALDCPILITDKNSLSTAASKTLKSLKVKKVIILGSPQAVGEKIVSDVKALGISSVQRLGGTDRFETQLRIYEYGRDKNLWSPDRVIIASGDNFADALSGAPIAAKGKYPIFLTDYKGKLNKAQEKALLDGAKSSKKLFRSSLILGAKVRVSAATEGYLQGISMISSGKSKASTRLAGSDRFKTSAAVATWAVKNMGFTIDKVAFASGAVPYDALGGGVLQAREGSVLLLVSDECTKDALSVIPKSGLSSIKFFGGLPAVSGQVRGAVLAHVGWVDITYTKYGISLSKLADLEVAASKGYQGYSKNDILASLNPAKTPAGSAGFYQFAILSDGYSGRVTAAQLDSYIASMVVYQESQYGVTSKLRGTGAAFISAAKKYNLNEVYLLAHAALESAWGCSTLAQGKVKGYSGYLNFYGIGAYDIDPLNGGAAKAKQMGWTTPSKAIHGAAAWLSSNYIARDSSSFKDASGNQNTLWKMKWDAKRAASGGGVWHQYATGRTWATGIASVMANCYNHLKISPEKTGLRYDYPTFS